MTGIFEVILYIIYMEYNYSEISRDQLAWQAVSLMGLRGREHIHSGQKGAQVFCPLCQGQHDSSSQPALHIYFQDGSYYCFKCRKGGKIENLFWAVTGTSLRKTLGLTNDPFSNFAYKVQYKIAPEEENNFPLKEVSIDYDDSNIVRAWDDPDCRSYLIKRGISEEVADSMYFMYTTYTAFNGSKFKNRLLIPVYEDGKLLSMEGRRIVENNEPKVLYPCGTTTSTLFDIDNLDRHKTLFVLEGLMDLAVLRSCPLFKNSTSIFGASLTKRQLHLLEDFDNIIYIQDLDAAGNKTVETLLQNSKLRDKVQVLKPPHNDMYFCKDVGDIPKLGLTVENFVNRKWLNTKVPIIDWKPYKETN